jgi:hypothetical protein
MILIHRCWFCPSIACFFERYVDALTTITYISYAPRTFIFKSYHRCNLYGLHIIPSTFPTLVSCKSKTLGHSYTDCPRFTFYSVALTFVFLFRRKNISDVTFIRVPKLTPMHPCTRNDSNREFEIRFRPAYDRQISLLQTTRCPPVYSYISRIQPDIGSWQ